MLPGRRNVPPTGLQSTRALSLLMFLSRTQAICIRQASCPAPAPVVVVARQDNVAAPGGSRVPLQRVQQVELRRAVAVPVVPCRGGHTHVLSRPGGRAVAAGQLCRLSGRPCSPPRHMLLPSHAAGTSLRARWATELEGLCPPHRPPEHHPRQSLSALLLPSPEEPKSTEPLAMSLTGARLEASTRSSQRRCGAPSSSQKEERSSV